MRRFGQITPGQIESELTARGVYSETFIPVEPENGIVIFPDDEVDRLQPVVTFPREDEVIRDLVPIPVTPPVKIPFEIPGKTILIAGLIGLALIMLSGRKAPARRPGRKEPAAPTPGGVSGRR